RAPVVLVVALGHCVVADRRGQVARVRKRRRGDDGGAGDVPGGAGWRVGDEARCRVVAVVLGGAAVGAGRSVAVTRLVQVVVDTGGPVRVHVTQDGELGRSGEGQCAGAVAQSQECRRLALVAHDGGGRRADGN